MDDTRQEQQGRPPSVAITTAVTAPVESPILIGPAVRRSPKRPAAGWQPGAPGTAGWFVPEPIGAQDSDGNRHRRPDRPDHHHHPHPARAL